MTISSNGSSNRSATVYVDADRVPDYLEKRRHYGLLTAAVPDFAEVDAQGTSGDDEQSEIAAVSGVWNWQWEGFIACRVGTGQVAEADVDIVHVDPTAASLDASSPVPADAIRRWLDDRLSRFCVQHEGRTARWTDHEVRTEVLDAARTQQPEDDDPPRHRRTSSVLGFLANLTALMAPIPQVGRLAHVVHVDEGALEDLGQEQIFFVPRCSFVLGGETVTIDADRIRRALDAATVSRQEVSLRFSLDGERSVRLVCKTVPADGPASQVGGSVATGLWSRATMRVGRTQPGLRAAVASAFDLVDPIVRSLDDLALVPDPIALFDHGARLLRDHVLPSPRAVDGLLRDMVRHGADEAAAQALSSSYQDLVTEYGETAGAWRGALHDLVPGVRSALDVWVEEPTAPHLTRTITPKDVCGDALGAVLTLRHRLHSDAETGGAPYLGRLEKATLSVDPPPHYAFVSQRFHLDHWDASRQQWARVGHDLRYHPSYDLTVGDERPARIDFDLEGRVSEHGEAIASAGLRVGRYRIVEDPIGAEVGLRVEFVLTSDHDGAAPLRALAASLHSTEEIANVFLGIMRKVAAAEPAALATQAILAGSAWQQRLHAATTRSAVRGGNLGALITEAMCPPLDAGEHDDPTRRRKEHFSNSLQQYWTNELDFDRHRLGETVVDVLRQSVTLVANRHLDRTFDPQVTSAPAPLEIELVTPVGDADSFDDFDSDDFDPFARLAGAAVLLRRAGDPWRCLNAAKVQLAEGAHLVSIAPLPVAYQDGVATTAVTYEGEPVAIASPVSSFRSAGGYALTDVSQAEGLAQSIAEYGLVTADDCGDRVDHWARPPRLAYGRTYEACGFFIHQSGALPKEIANPSMPWLLKSHTLVDDPPTLTKTIYLRTTPMAAPHIVDVDTNAGSSPSGVVPLAHDLPRTAVTAGGPARHFFGSPRSGEIDLVEGPWWLRLDDIDPRGYAERCTIDVAIATAAVDGVAGPRSLRFTIDFEPASAAHRPKVTVTSITPDGGGRVLTSESRWSPDAPSTIEIGYTPSSRDGSACEPSPARLWARCWQTASLPMSAPQELRLGSDLRYPNAYVTLSAREATATEDAATPSVSFGCPIVQTPSATYQSDDAARARACVIAERGTFPNSSLASSLRFGCQPPGVEHACWSRAFANDILEASGDDDRLLRHAENTHAGWVIGLELAEAAREAGREPVIDLHLDDPSIDALLIEAMPVFAHGRKSAIRRVTSIESPWLRDPMAPKGAIGPDLVHRMLEGARRGSDLPSLTVGRDDEVRCDPGEVWEISVRGLIARHEAETLTEGVRALLVNFVHEGVEWAATLPERLYVESATRELPPFDQIRAALAPRSVDRAIEVGWDPDQLGYVERGTGWSWPARRFAYVRDVLVARQLWRWNGRPIHRYPFESTGRFLQTPIVEALLRPGERVMERELERIGPVLAWEVQGFGDRDPADRTSSWHVVKPLGRTVMRVERFDGDTRAHHLRARATARSRYAALMENPRDGLVGEPAPNASFTDEWRRAFVASSAVPASIKPPSLRLILPLTESAEDEGSRRPPPLLAVLNDAWFDVGGLAEQLVVEIATTEGPDETLQEIGPDPIRAGARDERTSFVARAIGPIGYSRDHEGSATRFDHSSFVIDAEGAELADWSFVKLSLRRLLLPEGLVGYLVPEGSGSSKVSVDPHGAPAYLDLAVPKRTELVFSLSGSDPSSVQVEPGSYRVLVEREAVRPHDTGRSERWRVALLDREGGDGWTHVQKSWSIERSPAGSSHEPLELTVTASERAGVTVAAAGLRRYPISAPTPARWAQFASDFSRFGLPGGEDVHARDLVVSKNDEGWRIEHRTGEEAPIIPYQRPEIGSKMGCELWAVATTQAVDAGRRPIEVYAGLYDIDNAGRLQLMDGPGATNGARFRIIEVQSRLTTSPPEASGTVPDRPKAAWERLWPRDGVPANAADARARISKVSRVIESRWDERR